MSDEQGTTTRREAAPHVHYCEHPGCKAWGGWGFEEIKGQPHWFCYQHRSEGRARHA